MECRRSDSMALFFLAFYLVFNIFFVILHPVRG